MGMNMLALLLMTQLFGVQINNPDTDKITIVRTDQEPKQDHHSILDDPQFARLVPFTVTISSKEAVHAMAIQWDVVEQDGILRSIPQTYDGPFDGKFAVIHKGSHTEFWPGGRVSKDIGNRQPLMNTPSPANMDIFEKAKSVTVTVQYIEFEDGTTAGPMQEQYKAYLENSRLRRQLRHRENIK